MDFSFVMQ